MTDRTYHCVFCRFVTRLAPGEREHCGRCGNRLPTVIPRTLAGLAEITLTEEVAAELRALLDNPGTGPTRLPQSLPDGHTTLRRPVRGVGAG